ncbi:MAG: toprim domain-containing protein [Clostridium sp.]|nr:toprim domain-containing protein [Clostridium sp.]
MVSKGTDTISIDDVRRITTDYEVVNKYLGISVVPSNINSILREDKNPSLCIFPYKDGLFYKDFGTNQSGNIYQLLSLYWNIPLNQVYRKIITDFNSNNKLSCCKKSSKTIIKRKSNINIKVKIRNWKPWDIEYWNSYGISLKWLEYCDIFPISHIFLIHQNGEQLIISADKYAYVYIERKDNKVSLKIYQPYSTNFKWMSKHDASVWDLWTKIPEKGDKLIITSSRKDALCLWANTGIPSLSLQGEGYVPKEKVINQLKERYSKIYVFYDNDFENKVNNGRNYGRILAEKFNLQQIEIPTEYKSKDPSDLYKNWGKEVFLNVINQLIN